MNKTDLVQSGMRCSLDPPGLGEDQGSSTLHNSPGPNFMALLTAEIWPYNHHSPLIVQELNFCGTVALSKQRMSTDVECTHACMQKFSANLFALSASVNDDSLLTVSRAIKLDPPFSSLFAGHTVYQKHL